jgi:hypothetical protein
MSLENRIKKLEGRKEKKQIVRVLLPDWISSEPIVFESEHFGRVDIKPKTLATLRTSYEKEI